MPLGSPQGHDAAAHPPGSGAATALDGRQLALLEALSSKNELLAQMYMGALAAVERGDPESLVQSGHSMRELLEKLPRYFEQIPQERTGPSLGEAAKSLLAEIERASRNSRCYADGAWSGDIDGPLRKLLERAIPAFGGTVARMKPPRRTERSELLARVDVSPHPMPEVVQKLRIEEWEAHAGYFQGVSHHTITAELEEFKGMLWQCEQFLLDRLVPRTFSDRAEISAIVAEVEGGD